MHNFHKKRRFLAVEANLAKKNWLSKTQHFDFKNTIFTGVILYILNHELNCVVSKLNSILQF